MSDTENLLKLREALSVQALRHAKPFIQAQEEQSDEGGGKSGGDAGGVKIDMVMFVEVFGALRQGEKQFGPVSEFDAAAYLAKESKGLKGELGHEMGESLKAHPILSKLAKFDGDTPDMAIDPRQNPDAQARYENRLQLQLGMRQQLKATMKPGGM